MMSLAGHHSSVDTFSKWQGMRLQFAGETDIKENKVLCNIVDWELWGQENSPIFP